MPDKTLVDTIVRNGNVFTGDVGRPHLPSGSIAIDGGVIQQVGADADIQRRYRSDICIDAGGAIVHPGLIDTHFHLPTSFLHTMPLDIGPSVAPTADITYAGIKNASTEDSVAAFSAAVSVAFLRKGFTCFAEAGTVFETDAFAETVARMGIRALVSAPYGWDEMGSFRTAMPARANDGALARAPAVLTRVVDRMAKELARNRDPNALVRGFACLYGEGSASDDLLRASKSLADVHDTILSQHQGTQPASTKAEKDYFGESGFVRMARLGILDKNTMLTHANILDETDVEVILNTGTTLVWCPLYSMRFGLPRQYRCHFPEFYRKGVSISLAIDGIVAAPIGAAGYAATILAGQIGQPIPASAPFYMQTIHAARNLGLGDRIGSIEPGKRADIIVRCRGDMTQQPLDTLGAMVATSSMSIPVDTVIVDGRIVMSNGALTAMDEGEILADALAQRDAVFQRARG